MKTTAFAAVVTLALPMAAIAAPASAQDVSTKDFVTKAAQSDMFEVQSGKLAQDKAKNEDVKDFGDEMVEDHSATTKDLMNLIKDEKIDVTAPTSMGEKNKDAMNQLKQQSGAEFDRTYMRMQVTAHGKAVKLFEDYSKSGDNDALKEWASDTLPTLKDHLKEARNLNDELSKSAETAAADTDNMKSADSDTVKSDDKTANNDKVQPPAFDYVVRQEPTDWSAQALIGRDVENDQGESLGDINNVIVNEKGQVVAVTIGVGGFLGIGEKDVGVPFKALHFETAGKAADNSETADEATNEEMKQADEASRFDAEHKNMQIVLHATREQLENAPKFLWLDEQNEKRAESDTERSVQ